LEGKKGLPKWSELVLVTKKSLNFLSIN